VVSSDAERRTSARLDANAELTTGQVEGLLLWGWLGGYKYDGGEIKAGRLLTIEELGEILKSMHYHCSVRQEANMTSPGEPEGARRVPSHTRRVPAISHLARRRAGAQIQIQLTQEIADNHVDTSRTQRGHSW